MELSTKQSKIFVDWYMDRYGQKDENGEIITPVEIPIVPAEKQRDEIKEWGRIIAKMLDKKANDTYKYRTNGDGKRRRETMFEKAFNSLYLQYGPTFKNEDGTPAEEQLWLSDVLDIQNFLKTGDFETNVR